MCADEQLRHPRATHLVRRWRMAIYHLYLTICDPEIDHLIIRVEAYVTVPARQSRVL